ncbi:metal-dependent hydrolase [Aquamicrobium sp.]|uniref:metal-dependent hydrolase n=1 Tax=Aquamicrobium sp. TaxID=1872579 RepID=UPI002583F6F7|nr:metal-dependent hydrolase [Aquamicrobium sp.]MCK9550499.1 metal-dependent hydrolase [Aquamicrobium sp.]
MKLTWYGHSAFRIETGDATILIDPYLVGNPVWQGGWEEPAQGVTHVLLTHGHDDHISGAAEILKQSGAMLVANFEICMHLVGKGVSDQKINPGNIGGTVDCGGFTTTFVQALHSSSASAENGNVYLGNPGGLVLHFPDAPTLYHMGDTDIFSDMALINELHEPKIGIVPVGDRFTMGGAVAALACRRFFRFDTVVPCHFGTFPLLDQTADKFVEGLEGSGVKVTLPGIGKQITI